MTSIKVLSLFDGMSCGRVALDRLGIEVNSYYASEIDKYAIKIANKNYPQTLQLGDVNNWKNWDIPWNEIDLLFAGFPCQAWSVAGKQKGLEDPRGKLALTLLDIFNHLKSLNPNLIFLFENVRMKKENLDYMDSLFGVKHITINSSLVSAQNRVRCYWTNIENVDQPKDEKIYLKDILESGEVDRDKSYCIDANYFKGGSLKNYIEKARRQIVKDCPIRVFNIGKGSQGQRVYSDEAKSVTLSALGGGMGAKTGLYARAINYSSSGRGNGVVEDRTSEADKAATLTATGYTERSFTGVIGEDFTIRKLTPKECERLQTIDEGYTEGVSNSQRYKMLGNGWTVKVIEHILRHSKLFYSKALKEL